MSGIFAIVGSLAVLPTTAFALRPARCLAGSVTKDDARLLINYPVKACLGVALAKPGSKWRWGPEATGLLTERMVVACLHPAGMINYGTVGFSTSIGAYTDGHLHHPCSY